MDPLSLTASVIAVLQLTTTVVSYINDVKDASKEQRIVAIEAGNLYALLIRLRYRVESADDTWLNQVKLLGIPGGPLEQLKGSLEELVDHVGLTRKERKRDQIISSLKWSWKGSQIQELLDRIERLKTVINCALTDDLLSLTETIHKEVKTVSTGLTGLSTSTKQGLLRDKILKWLVAPDPSLNYNAALRRRYPETGSWLLKHQSFLDWKHSESSSLWLYANAGCGKTILCSTLLQHILQSQEQAIKTTLVCYFYFDFKDTSKQHCCDLLQSLAKQLAHQSKDLSTYEEMYLITCNDGASQPNEDMMRKLVQDAIKHSENTFIILDALDECVELDSLLALLKDMKSWRRCSIAATSRQKRGIEECFASSDHKINIESSLITGDIQAYTRDRVSRLKKWSPKIQEDIISTLTAKSDGMFQWVFCQLEAIAKCVKLSSLEKTLISLPQTLDETYTRMIHGIESAGHIYEATTALRWLCYSFRPLQVSELVDVLAIQIGEKGSFDPKERFPDPEDIKTVCSNLITYWSSSESEDEPEDKDMSDMEDDLPVRLSHFSVKEYLLSDRCVLQSSFENISCHSIIGESCLKYLMYVIKLGLSPKLVQQFPLVTYAAQYWFQHLQKLKVLPDNVKQLAFKLLTREASLLAWVQVCGREFLLSVRGKSTSEFWLERSHLKHPLVFAAMTGLPDLVQMILEDKVCKNLEDNDRNLALRQAAKSGSTRTVQLLLDAGANINDFDGFNSPVLTFAADAGKKNMVRFLRRAGADVGLSISLIQKQIVHKSILLRARENFSLSMSLSYEEIWERSNLSDDRTMRTLSTLAADDIRRMMSMKPSPSNKLLKALQYMFDGKKPPTD